MAEGLPEDVQSVRRTFDMFVHQNTEEINCLDFANAVRSLGYNPTNNQVDEVLKTAEKGEKDKLGFDEFVELLKNFDGCKKEDAEDSLREAFKKFDRDGNGFISPDELLYVVCNSGEKLSREEAEELISMFDTNSDGQLSWEEFVEFFKCDREAPEASMSIAEEETPEDDCAVGTSLIS